MSNKIKTIIISITLLLVPSFTMGYGRVSVTPFNFRMTIEKAEAKSDYIKVTNASEKDTVEIDVYVKDMVERGSQGALSLVDSDDERLESGSVTHLIKVNKDYFSLQPKESKKIRFTVDVPKDAASGKRYAGIVIESVKKTTEVGKNRIASAVVLNIPETVSEINELESRMKKATKLEQIITSYISTLEGQEDKKDNIEKLKNLRRIVEQIKEDINKEIAREEDEEKKYVEKTSRKNPAKINEIVVIKRDSFLSKANYEIELLETISGNEALRIIKEASRFNKTPQRGREYILAKFRVKVLEIAADRSETYRINNHDFSHVSQTGVLYDDFNFVVGLRPDMSAEIYEGGEHMGYVPFLVEEGDCPVAAIHRGQKEEAWFDLRSK